MSTSEITNLVRAIQDSRVVERYLASPKAAKFFRTKEYLAKFRIFSVDEIREVVPKLCAATAAPPFFVLERSADNGSSYLFCDGVRQKTDIDEYRYLVSWESFTQWPQIPDVQESHTWSHIEYPVRQVYRGAISEDAMRGMSKLWEHRWVRDYWHCGRLRLVLRSDSAGGLDAMRRSFDLADSLFKEIQDDMRIAREGSDDLDEWHSGLFAILPKCAEFMALFGGVTFALSEDNQDLQAYVRFVEEMIADIETLLDNILLRGILMTTDDPYTSLYLSNIDNREPSEAQRKLESICVSQVCLPRFWIRDVCFLR